MSSPETPNPSPEEVHPLVEQLNQLREEVEAGGIGLELMNSPEEIKNFVQRLEESFADAAQLELAEDGTGLYLDTYTDESGERRTMELRERPGSADALQSIVEARDQLFQALENQGLIREGRARWVRTQMEVGRGECEAGSQCVVMDTLIRFPRNADGERVPDYDNTTYQTAFRG